MITANRPPNIYVNPPVTPYLWQDLEGGELYVCTDNTRDKNVWVGQKGSKVEPI